MAADVVVYAVGENLDVRADPEAGEFAFAEQGVNLPTGAAQARRDLVGDEYLSFHRTESRSRCRSCLRSISGGGGVRQTICGDRVVRRGQPRGTSPDTDNRHETAFCAVAGSHTASTSYCSALGLNRHSSVSRSSGLGRASARGAGGQLRRSPCTEHPRTLLTTLPNLPHESFGTERHRTKQK